MNTRASGFEWLNAPPLALTRSDRLFFLPNLVSFLLLPGLIFSVFTRLGIRRRVAWHWMWLLPAGFCFVLQAGSVANDLFGAVFALTALDFALRAIKTRQTSDVWLSILAAALLTGAKASNLPLLLPWFVALLFSGRFFLRQPIGLIAVAVMAFFSSFLPNAVLNFRHCGDWTGSVLEPSQFRIHQPLLGIVGNSLNLGLQSIPLPVMPLPHETGEKIAREFLPQKFLDAFDGHFEAYFGLAMGKRNSNRGWRGIGFWFQPVGSGVHARGFFLPPPFCGRLDSDFFVSKSANHFTHPAVDFAARLYGQCRHGGSGKIALAILRVAIATAAGLPCS